MNSNSNLNLLKTEFKRIKSLGYIKNVKSDTNDGAAGNTFEYHLGVVENNLTNPASFKIGYNHYGFSMINFPSQIKLYNCRIKNYSLSVLDFGTLKDQIDNVVYKTFSAQEILLKYLGKTLIFPPAKPKTKHSPSTISLRPKY